ncbi:6151_t:CDS:2 [Acaulospora morrowiae]|uniref:rRNA-processing protein n=1 Tax=Acaulospora morrowiae TaxID=94023 RepID=A0A9N8ZE07_9GLOM|nr:6151_t:CDS:2 [Acaulospora morrowiae]
MKSNAEQAIGRRVSGKPWKYQKTATRRSQLQPSLRKGWDERLAERKEKEITKLLEQELKNEVTLEKERKREAALKRKQALEEKEKQEKLAAIYSAKKLKRLQSRKRKAAKK